jgi:two-component system chemotaxis response regulator CheY
MKTCLILDDSSIIRKVARESWKVSSFRLSRPKTVSKHSRPVSANCRDAILLDWHMPKMDGYKFLRILRRLPGGDRPKVVFCTTENDVPHIARALQAGANEYIMKPFDKDIVAEKFQEVGLI